MITCKGLSSLVFLQSFTMFPEYFISVSIVYILIVTVLIAYNTYGLMLQKAISECLAVVLLMACYLMVNDDLTGFTNLIFNNSIINDYCAFFTKFFICFCSSLYFFAISNSLKEQKLTSFEYLVIILFAILGLVFMCSSNDLLTAYLTIELSSLAFYMLASFKKTSSYSVESGIKYFVIGVISSAFFLLGSSFIYVLTGSINFFDFFDLFECSTCYQSPYHALDFGNDVVRLFYHIWYVMHQEVPELFNYNFAELGLTLILFSLFIKLALAPFHLWSLDVYEGSPTCSTFFFTVITKLSVFVLMIRLCYSSFFSLKGSWQFYSIWIGLISIFVGSFGGLKQRRLKTLLAYSSVSHMGYALIAFSTGTYLGIQMLLFYLVIYMISGLAIWYIVLFLRLKQKSTNKYNKEAGDLILLKKSNPALAFALALTVFSIAGIPPIIGFLAKFSIFLSVVGISFYFIALTIILLSVVSTFYYIRIVKIIYFENLLVGKLYYSTTSLKTSLFCIIAFSLLFLFVNPTFLYLINDKIILSLLFLS